MAAAPPAPSRLHLVCVRVALALAGGAAVLALAACTPSVDPVEGLPCPGLRVDEATARFLEAWTVPTTLRPRECVLPGRHGPEPRFDPSSLGPEQRLRPDAFRADTPFRGDGDFAPSLSAGYPIVFVGRVGDDGGNLFLAWRDEPGPVVCLGSLATNCLESAEVPGQAMIRSYGRGSTRAVSFELFVPEDTAVVALEVEGHAEGWQRPVARVAALQAPLEWASAPDFARFGEQGLSVRFFFLDAVGDTIEVLNDTLDW